MVGVNVDSSTAHEIEQAVTRSLIAGGVNATVKISARTLTLHADGPPVEIDALFLIEQWPLLPADLRERKAADVAARLLEASRAATAGRPAPSAAPPRYTQSVRPTGAPAVGPRKPITIPAGLLLLLAVVGIALVVWYRSHPTPPQGSGAASSSAPVETDEQRRVTLCEKARRNVLDKGTFLQVDAQSVWLVELWLATSKPGDDMARSLTALIDGEKLTAAADPDLAALKNARVELAADDAAKGAWRGVYVRFHGGYVSTFFDTPPGREKMNGVASRLADAAGAEMASLYGRCAHLPYHDVGAWFRGSTPQNAGASLVQAMALSSERSTGRAPAAAPDLAGVASSLAKLDKAALEGAVRSTGGTYAPGAGGAPTVITFPLFGPRLALQTSTALAKAAGL